MKLINAIQLYNVVQWMLTSPLERSSKFNYALLRNKNMLTPIINDHQENLKLNLNGENSTAYEADRLTLIKQHGILDENGNPLTNGDNFVIPDEAAFAKAHASMVENNPAFAELIEARNKVENDTRETDVAFVPHKISIDQLPEGVSLAMIEIIMPMIAD